MSAPEVAATVVGAGVAGLAAALELQRRLSDVVLIDASDRPGGVMRTDHIGGYVIERGPNTIQVKAPMAAFLARLGLERVLLRAQPASRLRSLYLDGRLVPVPSTALGLVGTPLFSLRGKLRLLAEPLLPRGDAAAESVAEFLGRRLGRESVERMIGPFLTGVYAGDERELGAASVFPALVELERRHRSLALGALWRRMGRRRAPDWPGTWSARQGLGPFARRVAERLREPPALGSRVRSIARDAGHWRLEVSGPGGPHALRSERLVLATSAPAAAALLAGVCAAAAEALSGIAYAPIVGVPFGVDPASLRTPARGFGFLVPRSAGLDLLGCLFMSELFPGRAPEGRALLHCILGGTRSPDLVGLPDDDVVKRAVEGLDRTLGLAGEPRPLAVTRWPLAIPQPDRHHAARLAEVRRRLAAECPGLALAGAYLGGVAVSDALASGVAAAAELAPV